MGSKMLGDWQRVLGPKPSGLHDPNGTWKHLQGRYNACSIAHRQPKGGKMLGFSIVLLLQISRIFSLVRFANFTLLTE
jgi:hypothetical protein